VLPAAEPDVPPRRVGRNEQLEAQLEALRDALRIVVIADAATAPALRGLGVASEAGATIADALTRAGFRHVELLADDLHLGQELRRSQAQLAWLAGSASQRDNPGRHAAGLLEKLGLPYVGHRPPQSTLLENKEMLKRYLASLGIPTAPFVCCDPENGPFRPKVHSRFIRAFRNHWGKFVVKPASGSAAAHLVIVDSEADLPDAVARVHDATGKPVLIEAYLPGAEYSIAICGRVTARMRRLDRGGEPFAFSPLEHFGARPDRQFRRLDPAGDSADLAQLHELAREAFVELNLETLVRWDVRADATGAMFVLDADSTPLLDIADHADRGATVAGLAAHGMDFDDLVLSLLADKIDLLMSRQRGTPGGLSAR
jgi:D-alanine-D-alanine ligase